MQVASTFPVHGVAWVQLQAKEGAGHCWVMPEGTGWEFLSKDCLALKSCGQEKALNASHQ